MVVRLSNNATSTLAAPIEAIETEISIVGGDAAKFPTLNDGDWCPITVVSDAGAMEIMKVTARDGAVLTVERAQEGTTALDFALGALVQLRMTAGTFAAILGEVEERFVPKVTVYTASGTHSFSPTTKAVRIQVWGAGGGGRNTDAGTPRSGPGGGAGGYAEKILDELPSGDATITVGAAGAAGSSGGNSTYADGTTTVTGNGGSSGVAVASSAAANPSNGGTATGGDLNITGGLGEPTIASALCKAGDGGLPPMGVGRPGIGFSDNAGIGVYTFMTAGGYCAGGAGANNNGSAAARTAGMGAPGLVIITEYG